MPMVVSFRSCYMGIGWLSQPLLFEQRNFKAVRLAGGAIRQDGFQEVKVAGELLIIDSFPVPVCQPVRNYRVKIFRGIADIGYKATKKVYY